jgi:hypothetical protein
MKKKKSKDNKKQDMPEFQFKQFTPEEDRLYEEAINKYREAIALGKSLRQAFESHRVADSELENIIQADFLKILIAERHFAQRQPLDEIARDLDISVDLVKDSHARMLQEVGVTAANQFGQEFTGFGNKTND